MSKSERQSEIITFRMSGWMKGRIEELSAQRGISQNEFIRGVVLKEIMKGVESPHERESVRGAGSESNGDDRRGEEKLPEARTSPPSGLWG